MIVIVLDYCFGIIIWLCGLVASDNSLTSYIGYSRQVGHFCYLLQVVGQSFIFICNLAIVCIFIL